MRWSKAVTLVEAHAKGEVGVMRFKGIHTPIITPFRQDFSIDWDAYAEVIGFQTEAGAAGVIGGCSTGEGDITAPFCGYKPSGFGGRDNALAANDQCTETKTIWIDLSDDHIDDTITGSTAQS